MLPQSPPPYSGVVNVYREEDEIVFVGEEDWSYRVPLAQVSSDEGMRQVCRLLRAQPWMSDALDERFRSEVAWLRMQLPPGK